jgi:acetyl esterase/lipase
MVGTARRRIVGSMTSGHSRRGLLAGGVLVTGVSAAWFGRRRSPRRDPAGPSSQPQVVRYGDDPSQFAELSVPAGRREVPVAVVIHGGFWRQRFDLSLGRPLAATLPARGWAALNIEYRRVDGGGGYPATLDDVSAAIDALAGVDAALDLRSVVTIGHSAGGHLAAWSATRRDPAVPVTAVVSQAGVLDLRRAAVDQLGAGATQTLLGGDPAEVPERYDDASPIERLPLGVPVLCVHGRADTNVPFSQSEDFVAAARTAGDDAELQAVDGDHFVVIDPTSDAWASVLRWLDERRR